MTGNLIRLRSHWWAIATSRMFMRHWQWFALAGVLVPMGTTLRNLLHFLILPLLHVFESGHDMGWHLARVGLIQFIASGWVSIQRRAISGGEFAPYLRTLPLTAPQRLITDAAVIMAANTLLLVPVAAALLLAPTLGVVTAGELLTNTAGLSALALLTQIAWLKRCPLAIVSVVAGNIALSWILSGGLAFVGWAMLAASLVFGLWALSQVRVRCSSLRPMIPVWRHMLPARLIPLPTWRIQCKTITSQVSSLIRAFALLVVVLGTHVLLTAFGFDDRSLPTTALALAALALVTSGWYRTLHDARAPVSPYLNTLPLPSHFWQWLDIRFIITVGTLPASAVLGSLLAHLPRSLSVAATLLVAYWILLAKLRIPVLHGGRQATLLAVLLTGTWSAVAIAATI